MHKYRVICLEIDLIVIRLNSEKLHYLYIPECILWYDVSLGKAYESYKSEAKRFQGLRA